MSLRGRGFLPMWFECAEGFEREFDRWHTIEHMPERLGIPGFLRGRRYLHARSHRIFFSYMRRAISSYSARRATSRASMPLLIGRTGSSRASLTLSGEPVEH